MAYTTINKSTDYFNTKLYTGNGSTQSITGVGFQPDWVWLKQRANDVSNRNHMLFDSVRGTQKALSSNTTGAEDPSTSYLTSYDSDGFAVGASSILNRNTTTYASWNWLAANGTASNSDGSITSTVSANQTAGFSIVSYTGTGSVATVGHGLGTIPSCYIVKNLSDTAGQSWNMYHHKLNSTPEDFTIFLNSTSAKSNEAVWNDTAPTSSVFSIGTARKTNYNGDNYIAYCFAEKTGYSKFGSYTGNGNADGTFVYTGFKPAFLLWKNSSSAEGWWIVDNKRTIINPTNNLLRPDTNAAELVGNANLKLDLLSNGFKLRQTDGALNSSGATFIYMAFGQSLVGSNNVPCTAR
jgi:hypothetical protein